MKIVYCISAMWKSGGIERVITGKANYLVERGYDVTIITTDQRDRNYFFSLDERVKRIDLGLDYDKLDALSAWKRVYYTWRTKGLHQRRLTEVLRSLQADFVISVWRQEVSFLPQIKDGSKKILELHTSKYARVRMYPREQRIKRLFGYLRMKLDEIQAREYDIFVPLTNEEKALWASKNVIVIPNACSFSAEQYANVENKEVITAGRFEYVKNYTDLIDIWAIVAPQATDWRLRICGSGWLEGRLRQKIKQLGLENSIIITPSTPAIQTYYQNASIYALTSHYEGLPMVLLEAQAMGLPIVSYACQSGPRDIITDGEDGFLVSLYDKNEFSHRLLALMHNESLRKQMKQHAIVASDRFSQERVMQMWEKLFQESRKKI